MSVATIYSTVVAALTTWATTNSFTVSAEGASLTDGRTPNRVCVFYVISDVDGGFMSNARRRTRYRVQVDLGVPPSEKKDLPGYLESMETALMAGGGMPQGNRRMRDDETAQKAVISKDYTFVLGR